MNTEQKELENLISWVQFYKANTHSDSYFRHDNQFIQCGKAREQMKIMKEEFNLKK